MKKALITGALVLLVNIGLLAGATYAWWSEEIVVDENIIQMGELDVLFEAADDEAFTLNAVELDEVSGNKVADFDNIYPGKTVTRYIRVTNTGTIRAVYEFDVDINAERNLADLITFTVTGSKETLEVEGLNDRTDWIALDPGEEHVYQVQLVVSSEMGNEWQNSLYKFNFTLEVRQYLEMAQDGQKIIE